MCTSHTFTPRALILLLLKHKLLLSVSVSMWPDKNHILWPHATEPCIMNGGGERTGFGSDLNPSTFTPASECVPVSVGCSRILHAANVVSAAGTCPSLLIFISHLLLSRLALQQSLQFL